MNKRWIPGVVLVVGLAVAGCLSAMQAADHEVPVVDVHDPAEVATVRATACVTPDADGETTAPDDEPVAPGEADAGVGDGAEEETADVAGPTPLLDPVLPKGVITGVVVDGDGPVPGAAIRIQATDYATTAGEDGTFELVDVPMTEPVIVAAWVHGYYNGHAEAIAGLVPVTITLKPYYLTDNLDYDWFEFDGVMGSASCEPCHPQYEEWLSDAHSRSAVNPRFVSMYEGTDVNGNRSPRTVFNDDGGIVPPDPETYYGPGVRTDYPDRTWNCAACHVPMASNLAPDDTCGWSGCHRAITAERSDELSPAVDAADVSEVNAGDGVGCDFCHKIGEVYLGPATGLPYSDRPGISSMKLFRPEEGEQLFFGTSDDDIRRVSKLELLDESAYCAGCHYGVFSGVVADGSVRGGVTIYNSYGEWLESPYSDPETGKTCQDCHMPKVDYEYFVYPEKGGLVREGFEVHDHDMPGIDDLDFMQDSLTMTATASREGAGIAVTVDIVNDNTGHHVPTGAPQRHLILVVEAIDADGNALAQATGPALPDWAGSYAGQAGEAYAKVLRDEWSGESPSAAYWRDVTLVSDNRIGAYETASSTYIFSPPDDGDVTVTATLWYRRSFQALAELKGWDDPDIQLATSRIEGIQ